MVSAQRKALERLWKDRCTIYTQEKVKDPTTKLTDFEEKPLFQDQPCKLSFETLNSSSGDPVAVVSQTVKLFLSPDLEIPAGCKIVVTRFNDLERKFTYSQSGEAGVFTNHQEIQLVPFKGYA
jgi:hypothetical protein